MNNTPDRQKLESLRLSIAQLAILMDVDNPLIGGNINDCMRRAKTQENGWNTLVLDMIKKFEEIQAHMMHKMEYDITG